MPMDPFAREGIGFAQPESASGLTRRTENDTERMGWQQRHTAVYRCANANAGIEGGSAQSARRTFAVKQHRQGRDLVHIATILGHKSVSTTKRLVEGDPVRLADIVAKAV